LCKKEDGSLKSFTQLIRIVQDEYRPPATGSGLPKDCFNESIVILEEAIDNFVYIFVPLL